MTFWVKFQGVEIVFCLEIRRGGETFSVYFQGVEIVFRLEIPRGGVLHFGLNSRGWRLLYMEIPRGVCHI